MKTASRDEFLAKQDRIAAKHPLYKLGHSGLDGYCDCIGLDIGSLELCGVKWNGIHGTNYAARYRIQGVIQPIKAVSDLKVGEFTFKATANQKDLPNRYKKGGAYYNGDLNDYYHVGTVISVNPLRIRHMTSPTVKIDTKLGKWGYHGACSLIDMNGNPVPVPVPEPITATVVATSGQTVNMRKGAGLKYRIVTRVPIGATVIILEPGEDWTKVEYDRKVGWMMDKFLDYDGKEVG